MARIAKASLLSKIEYRTAIRYLLLKVKKSGKEIHAELVDVYGSYSPSHGQVKF